MSRVDFFEVIGSGEVTKFFAHMMYRKTRFLERPILGLSEGTVLAAYLIHLAKNQLNSIGGKSQIATLDWSGNLKFANDWDVPRWESFFAEYQWQSNAMMLDCADPASSEEDFNVRLDGWVLVVKAMKRAHIKDKAEWDERMRPVFEAMGMKTDNVTMPSTSHSSED